MCVAYDTNIVREEDKPSDSSAVIIALTCFVAVIVVVVIIICCCVLYKKSGKRSVTKQGTDQEKRNANNLEANLPHTDGEKKEKE